MAAALILVGCGADDAADADAGYPQVTTSHCEYAPVPPTAGAGGTVTAGALEAGAAEVPLEVPVSTALGSYTARANFLGGAGKVDQRQTEINGKFNASIGIETRPMVKALALSAGGETVVILKVDLGFSYEGYTFELEQRLGAELHGKVLITASHSHSSWGQYSDHDGIGGIGAGQVQKLVHDNFLDGFEAAARAALEARQPARLGVAVDTDFDPDDRITRDRRGENDALSGGPRDDNMFFLIRVEATDGTPIAALPIFGMHGTLQDDDNSFTCTDASGGIERMLEEQFDDPVVVIHLQGAAGDVSPVGHGRVDCDNEPGNPGDPCWQWLTAEGLGREALPLMLAAWDAAGAELRDSIELEMARARSSSAPGRRRSPFAAARCATRSSIVIPKRTRTGVATRAQPPATIERVSGLARFVWVGDHPARGTPLVTLQRETSPGVFEDVERRSGRKVTDHDLLLTYDQLPLRPDPGEALTHFRVAEWQAVPWTGSGALDGLAARVGCASTPTRAIGSCTWIWRRTSRCRCPTARSR